MGNHPVSFVSRLHFICVPSFYPFDPLCQVWLPGLDHGHVPL